MLSPETKRRLALRKVLADQSATVQLDACDFRSNKASTMVAASGEGETAVVRNARLSTENYVAIE